MCMTITDPQFLSHVFDTVDTSDDAPRVLFPIWRHFQRSRPQPRYVAVILQRVWQLLGKGSGNLEGGVSWRIRIWKSIINPNPMFGMMSELLGELEGWFFSSSFFEI
jgi:hypothetical protein